MAPRLFFVFLSVLLLTGCMSRTQADDLLAKGCEAGIQAILPAEFELGEVKKTSFTHASQGPDFRHVTLVAIEKGDWLEEEKEYTCIFQESFGFLNMGYNASIYQLRTDQKIVGKSGNEILGDTQDFIKLTDAIRRAMYD